MYKVTRKSLWTSRQICFAGVKREWAGGSDYEKSFVVGSLAYFTLCEVDISRSLALHSQSLKAPEIQSVFSHQYAMKEIHAKIVANALRVFLPFEPDRQSLFEHVAALHSVALKSQWDTTYLSETTTLGEHLTAVAVAKGIFSSGVIAALLCLRRRGSFQRLGQVGALIGRDLARYAKFASILARCAEEHPARAFVVGCLKKAVNIETEFFRGLFFRFNLYVSDLILFSFLSERVRGHL